jgi:hypothetical protein
MRRGILSDAAIRRMHPESFVPDSLTHQRLYHDGVDIHRHGLSGIKRPRTPHGHLKSRPRRPVYDFFLQSQAVDPLTPQMNKAVGIYRRAVQGDAPDDSPDDAPAAPPTSYKMASTRKVKTGDRQMYIDRFDAQYQNLLNVARIDARTKIFLELSGLDPFQFIPPKFGGSRPRISAGHVRNEVLGNPKLTEDQEETIEGSFRLSQQIAHEGLTTTTPSTIQPFHEVLESFGYAIQPPDE